MKTTQKKMSRISAEILQLEKSIAESQEKLSALKKEKIEVENTEIVSIIRKADLSVDDVAELVSELTIVKKANTKTHSAQAAEISSAENILKGNDSQ